MSEIKSIFKIKLAMLAEFKGYKQVEEECLFQKIPCKKTQNLPTYSQGIILSKGLSIENLINKLRVLHISQ